LTIASDWYATEAEFRQLCGDAVSQARTEAAQEFANKMVQRAKAHGLATFVSEKQMAWLCEIADHEVPEKRSAR
jgi:hypothetical protein